MTFNPTYPGVYIEEFAPGAPIEGVGTSTVAFVGPARHGPVNEPRRVTSLDEFVRLYGEMPGGRPSPYLFVGKRPFYLGFGVEGFFQNGGRQAFVVRIGTARTSALTLRNRAGEAVAVVRARQEGQAGDDIAVTVEPIGQQSVRASATISAVASAREVTLADGSANPFQVGDVVTSAPTNAARITQIQGRTLSLDADLTGVAVSQTLRLAPISASQRTVRLRQTAGLRATGAARLAPASGTSPAAARVQVEAIDAGTGRVTLADQPALSASFDPTTGVVLAPVAVIATGQSNVTAVDGARLTVGEAGQFRRGDTITTDGANRGTVERIQGSILVLDAALAGAATGNTVRIANLTPGQASFRVTDPSVLRPGTVVLVVGQDAASAAIEQYAVVASVSADGTVILDTSTPLTRTFAVPGAAANAQSAAAPYLVPQDFRLVVTPPTTGTTAARPERHEGLSLNPFHPRYLFNEGVVDSDWLTVEQPDEPTIAVAYPDQLVAPLDATNLALGSDDQPTALDAAAYQAGLDALRAIDDVNMVCIPDAALHPERQSIQNAMRQHCLDLRDRVALFDSVRGAEPFGPNSVEVHRQQVETDDGFGALYYPWLLVRDPLSSGPQPGTLLVPPSGHVAGIFARTDSERGVHKAPANTDVRGVLGLERRLTNEQQGPLNVLGVNVIRSFATGGVPIIWGARTTAPTSDTTWRYVNVRRLFLFLEESIEEGIRWSVFEPNNLELWEKLKRSIGAFLSQVWEAGALFGASAADAYYVRIDEGLNPPATRALGRLFIEVGVRPSYPAEFIRLRIGIWEGGSETAEG